MFPSRPQDVQSSHKTYMTLTDRQTDRQTDRRSVTLTERFIFTARRTARNAQRCTSYTISVRPSFSHISVFCPDK